MSLRLLLDSMARDPRPRSYAALLRKASDTGVTHAVRDGRIVRLLPNQFVAGLHADAWLSRALAALAWAGSGARLDGPSALWACGAADAPEQVHIVVPAGEWRPTPPWLVMRTASYDLPSQPYAPWPAVSAGDAVVRAFALAPPRERDEAVFAAVRRGAVNAQTIEEAAARTPRIPERRRLMRLAAQASVGIESYLEAKGACDVLTGPGFAHVVRQHRVRHRSGVARIDAFEPRSLTAIEFDGEQFHTGEARLRDVRRDAALAALGILTLRFSYADVEHRPEWCRELALAAVRERVSRPQDAEAA